MRYKTGMLEAQVDVKGPRKGLPLSGIDSTTIADLRSVLLEVNYTEDGIREVHDRKQRAGSANAHHGSIHEGPVPPHGSLSTLARLFHSNSAVRKEIAREAIGWSLFRRLEAAGLLEADGEVVQASVRISPYKGSLIAYDQGSAWAGFVPGVSASSRTLASLIPRHHVRKTLDLGVGCGVQAMLAARHSDHVIAVDINQRSLEFASFGARLNGVSNFECRLGNLLEPVTGDRFDLIISNPPNVISPDSTYVFQNGGSLGDTLCRELVHEIPEFLNPNGFAVLLCQWAQQSEDDWITPVHAWLRDSGCDAWVLRYRSWTPSEYAAFWNDDLLRSDAVAYNEALDRWMAYFLHLGIEALSFGAVVIRRRLGRHNWVRCADARPVDPFSDHGEDILHLFRAQDYLATARSASLVGASLMDRVFRLRTGQQTLERPTFGDGHHVTKDLRFAHQNSLAFLGPLDAHVLDLISKFDGRRTLREAITALIGESERDPKAFMARAMMDTVRLVEMGILVGN